MQPMHDDPVLTVATSAIIYAMAVLATVTDVRDGKVYNWLTVPGAALGLALNTWFLGFEGTRSSLIGLGIGVAVWFVMPILGKPLGGGDVKFLAAIGALRGPQFLLYTMILAFLWAGLMGIVLACRQGRFLACARRAGSWLLLPPALRTDPDTGGLETAATGVRVPFAAATGLGALTAALVLRGSPLF